jgi:hypothetical protein
MSVNLPAGDRLWKRQVVLEIARVVSQVQSAQVLQCCNREGVLPPFRPVALFTMDPQHWLCGFHDGMAQNAPALSRAPYERASSVGSVEAGGHIGEQINRDLYVRPCAPQNPPDFGQFEIEGEPVDRAGSVKSRKAVKYVGKR